jgi:hypothetical protein
MGFEEEDLLEVSVVHERHQSFLVVFRTLSYTVPNFIKTSSLSFPRTMLFLNRATKLFPVIFNV